MKSNNFTVPRGESAATGIKPDWQFYGNTRVGMGRVYLTRSPVTAWPSVGGDEINAATLGRRPLSRTDDLGD